MASAKSAAEYCDVGLGLKMQQQQEAGGSGPSSWNDNNSSNNNNHLAGDDNHGSNFALPRTTTFTNPSANYFNHAGGASMGVRSNPFRFTAAQWQELERQTMIYKFILASVPVPPELLIPISRNLSSVAASHSNRAIEYGYPTNGSDPEPWRCRRTDGKKWRCSRDVAPDQKYCERHAHKNRPRSRKPVELQAQFNDKNNSSSKKTHSLDANKSLKQRSSFLNQATADHHLNPYPSVASAISSYNHPRCSPDWFMKGEQTVTAVSNPSQDWRQMMPSKVELRRDETNYYRDMSGCNRQGEEPMNTSLGTPFGDGPNDQCSLLLGPKLGTLGGGATNLEHTQTPRDFIDAWSAADNTNHKRAASSTGKLPLSSLTLSMYGGNGLDEEKEQAEMSLGDSKSQPLLNWMSPGSWMSSPPGGPLAEALCLGIASNAKLNSDPASPHPCNSKNTISKSSSEESSHGLNF